MTQVLHLSSRWNKFLVSLLISIKSFSLVAEFHLKNLRCFHKSTMSLHFFVVGFPTTPFDPSPKDDFSSSFEVEDVVFSSVLLIPFLHLLRRQCVVDFIKYISSHLVNIILYAFLFQPECYRN